MTYDDWHPLYTKLVRGRDKPINGEQLAQYFEVLQGFPAPILEKAIVKWNGLNRNFPQAADLKEMASGILAGATYTPPQCSRCHGDWFIAAESQEHFQRSYAYVRPCPECKTVKKPAA